MKSTPLTIILALIVAGFLSFTGWSLFARHGVSPKGIQASSPSTTPPTPFPNASGLTSLRWAHNPLSIITLYAMPSSSQTWRGGYSLRRSDRKTKAYWATYPPSTAKIWPVVRLDADEARNMTAPIISSG